MKISTAGLKRLIREELFYREFHRQGDELNEQDDFPEEVEPYDTRQLKLPIGTLHPDQLTALGAHAGQIREIHDTLSLAPFDVLDDPSSDKHDPRMEKIIEDLWDASMVLAHIAGGAGD